MLGEERIGPDRTGHDRTEQDRTGQDWIGQDRTGLDKGRELECWLSRVLAVLPEDPNLLSQ